MLIAAAVVAAAGTILVGGRFVASAQDSSKESKKPAAGAPGTVDNSSKGLKLTDPKDSNEQQPAKQDSAETKKLRSELDDLLNQRAEIDRKIAAVRGKLGPNARTQQRFEFRNGDNAPRIFEFNGDGSGAIPPEARKQIEEMQKQMKEIFGNMKFENMPMFDFNFDGNFGQDGGPDSKAFRDRIEKWSQQFGDRFQRRFNNGQGKLPGDKPQEGKPQDGKGKSAPPKIKTLDA